ncbi:MAG: pyridoxamine 5'-phosphate oxidase family protein [Thermoproteota archaeon]|nr:pyridoxamine 5'-phosphate oxidase family protein [Thermoproteota archaeon]
MGLINDDILRVLIKQKNLVLVGTVDPGGIPNISPRFVLDVINNEKLLFADAFENKTFHNIESWPKVAVAIVDRESLGGYQLKGDAEIVTDAPLVDRARIMLKELGINANPVRTWILNVKEIFSLIPHPKSRRPFVSAYT